MTFFPPDPPTYTIDTRNNEIIWTMQTNLYGLPMQFANVEPQICKIRTKRGEDILGFLYHPLRVRNESGNPRPFTILYSHANGTDCGAMRDIYQEMAERLQCDVFAFEYTGYGCSTGTHSEKNLYADVEAAYHHLHTVVGCAPEHIIPYGQSLGSTTSVYLASRKQIGGLVVHAGFMSGLRILTTSRSIACLDVFKNVEKMPKVKAPVLIIHGEHDEVIPLWHAKGLYNAVNAKYRRQPWYVPGAGHNNIVEVAGEMYFQVLNRYLDSLVEYTPNNQGSSESSALNRV